MPVARQEAEADAGETPDQPYRLMIISEEEHATWVTIAWVDETLAVLDTLS